ncbi:MAG: hypothetical protein WBA74_16215, partial [Cyclobacteriaceae bacterium]
VKKHRQYLENVSHQPDSDLSGLNSDFEKGITKINSRLSGKIHLIVLAGIVLVLSLYRMPFDGSTEVWKWAKIPIIVFYVLVLAEFVSTWNKLTTNIEKAEKLLVKE